VSAYSITEALMKVERAARQTLHYVDGSAVLSHPLGVCALCDALRELDEERDKMRQAS